MKEIICKECGDVIQNGYDVNPSNSEICAVCLQDLEEANLL